MRRVFIAILCICACWAAGFSASPCRASENVHFFSDLMARYETSAGGDFTGKNTSLYSALIAPFSGDVRQDGVRVRVGGGYGWYSYSGKRWNGATQEVVTFNGRQAWADVLLGYQVTLGPWIVKAYAGGVQEQNAIAPFDTDNQPQGGGLGVKVVLETWWRIGDAAFLQTDASWSGVFDQMSARSRFGYRVTPAISTGLEAAASANKAYSSGRGGLFARYEWRDGEASVSAGAAGDAEGLTGPYGSLTVLLRF